MNILVTGGSGFIGRYVVNNLMHQGHEVTIYDVSSPKFECDFYIEGSMIQTARLEDAVKKSDAVMHLAGKLGTSETLDHPIMPTKINVMGSLTLFQFCKQYKKRCCYIGVGNHFMFNTYAISKTCAEKFALMYNAEHNTKIAVVRGLNAYGPYQKHKPVRKVIPNFVLPALRDEPITIYGSGEQVMDFIYVNDLAEILCRALLMEHSAYDFVIEAGSGQKTSINFIAEKVIELAGSKSKIEHVNMRPGEIPDSVVVADIKTLKPLKFGAADFTPLEDGLKKTIEFYRGNLMSYK
jgi:UDP-glucose 4-epimerase